MDTTKDTTMQPATDAVIEELRNRLEAAEKDVAIKEEVIDSLATVIKRLDAQCDAAEKERDALRAKIEAMEKQKPAGKFIQHPSNGLWEQDGYGDNPDARPLYALPGAQPAPSFADAYQGAMEEVAIWKRRALEAEDLNRKFIAKINGPMHMGEPAQPAQRMDMQTADQITQAFKSELQALLDKYGAELSARDTWEGYPECGEDVRMYVDVPAIYDADHNCLREYTEIDLGSWVSSTQAMPKEIKP